MRLQSLVEIPAGVVHITHVAVSVSHPFLVAQFLVDGKGLPVHLQGLVEIPAGLVHVAHVAVSVSHPFLVAQFLVDG